MISYRGWPAELVRLEYIRITLGKVRFFFMWIEVKPGVCVNDWDSRHYV